MSSVLLAAVRSLPLKGLRLLTGLEVGAPGWDVSAPGPDPSTGWGAPTVGTPIFAAAAAATRRCCWPTQVAAIRVPNGPIVRTERAAGLPFGLRAAVYRQTDIGEGSGAPVALNAAGQAIPSGSAGIVDSPTLRWKGRAPPGCGGSTSRAGPTTIRSARCCQLRHAGRARSRGSRGLQPVAGAVATAVVANPGILGRGFLACVDAGFEVGRVQTSATVLLDARDPGTMPAPLPGTTLLRGHAGIVAGKPAAPADGALLYAALYDEMASSLGAWATRGWSSRARARSRSASPCCAGCASARPKRAPNRSRHADHPASSTRSSSGRSPDCARQHSRAVCAALRHALHDRDVLHRRDWTLQAHVWLATSVGHGLAAAQLRPVRGASATYVARSYGPGDRFDGVWHRIGKVWLIVEGGRSVAQDIAVSKALTVKAGPG